MSRTADEEFDIWADKMQELFLVLVATVGLIKLRASYKMVNHHYAIALAARMSIEAAGLIIAEQIDGQSGVDAWRRYSNKVFSVDDMGLIPDPIAVLDSIAESEEMIREHYQIDEKIRDWSVVHVNPGSKVRSFVPDVVRYGYDVFEAGKTGLFRIRTFTL